MAVGLAVGAVALAVGWRLFRPHNLMMGTAQQLCRQAQWQERTSMTRW